MRLELEPENNSRTLQYLPSAQPLHKGMRFLLYSKAGGYARPRARRGSGEALRFEDGQSQRRARRLHRLGQFREGQDARPSLLR